MSSALKHKLSDFDYKLPPERIAQKPLAERDTSRLLVLKRDTGEISHSIFSELSIHLTPGDVLVLNDTRVSAQRLFGSRPGHPGERVEAFLTHRITESEWQSLVRPGKKLLPGVFVEFGEDLVAEVVERLDDRGGRLLRFSSPTGKNVDTVIERCGAAPLPPYITEQLAPENRGRYQTVYASYDGSAAAPTAGLHFTPELLDKIRAVGVIVTYVTLHVGLGTFRPIEVEDIT
jgi:S-adenosylmethionine:tRNA ribosyltransferase-isomerase